MISVFTGMGFEMIESDLEKIILSHKKALITGSGSVLSSRRIKSSYIENFFKSSHI